MKKLSNDWTNGTLKLDVHHNTEVFCKGDDSDIDIDLI